MRYSIGIRSSNCNLPDVIIRGLTVDGNKDEIAEKMSKLNYVRSLGIPEIFYFEKFELIPLTNKMCSGRM